MKAASIAKAAAAVKTKHLNAKQWAAAEAIWAAGMMTVDTIAAKFGVTERTVLRHMKAAKIERNSKASEHRAHVEEEIKKIDITDATILAARIRETKEEHYKMATGLGKLIWQEILKFKTDGASITATTANIKAFDLAITGIKKIREEKWALLGLDKEDFVDDDALPDLMISELTAEEVEALRARDHTEFDNFTPPAAIENSESGEAVDDDEIVEE